MPRLKCGIRPVCPLSKRVPSFMRYAVAAAGPSLSLVRATPSYAIPSPDLVVGSLSSISQLIALVSAMIGGGAVIVGARARYRSIGGEPRFANCMAHRLGRLLAVPVLDAVAGRQLLSSFPRTERSRRRTRLESFAIQQADRNDHRTAARSIPISKEGALFRDQIASPRGLSTEFDVQRLLAERQQGLDGRTRC